MKLEIKSIIYIAAISLAIIIPCGALYPLHDRGIPEKIPDRLFIIARQSIMHQMETNQWKSFMNIECSGDERGIFVRLIGRKGDRGCIGFVRGVSSLEEAVRAAAVDAAFFDSRYKHVSRREIDGLVMEITLIGKLEKMKRYDDFIPGRHTIYIIGSYGKAVMQAQIAMENGWNREEFLRAICRKAGIDETSYKKPGTEIYRAETISSRKRISEISTGK